MIVLHRLTAHNFKQLTNVDLRFPDEGTILIEGVNEAGKSSLFEAAFFALYGHGLGTASHADLKNYGADELNVALEFSIDGRPFSILRKIAGNQRVELTCPSGNGSSETLRSTTAVKKRLQDELRISDDALLNTCFVEQKHLDQLENLDAGLRRSTINELLNLKVLTELETEFKITSEDKQQLLERVGRVRVARLDAELPALQAAEFAASCCLRYTRLMAYATVVRAMQEQIERDEATIAKIGVERTAIREKQAHCAALRSCLAAIEGDLAERVAAWKEADVAYAEASERLRALREMAAALPDRWRRQEGWDALGNRLAGLERLEEEAVELRRDHRDVGERVARYDEIEVLWHESDSQVIAMHVTREERNADLAAAEETLRVRQSAQQRMARLSLLVQSIQSWEMHERDAAALHSRCEAARDAATRLPALTARGDALAAVVGHVRRREEDRRALERAQEDLGSALRAQEDHTRRTEILHQREAYLAELEARLAEARAGEQAAAITWRGAQVRAALQSWIAAGEQLDASRTAAADGALEAEANQIQKEADDIGMLVKQASRKTTAALVVCGVGIVAAALGAAARSSIVAALGAVILVAGAAVLAVAKRALVAATEQSERATETKFRIEAEARAWLAHRDAAEHLRRQWETRQQDCLAELERLQEPPPTTRDQALVRLDALPTVDLVQAETAYRNAEAALREGLAAQDAATSSLELARQHASEIDPHAVGAQVVALRERKLALEQALVQVADLPDRVRDLDVTEDLSDLESAAHGARNQIATGTAAADGLPDLEQQRQEKAQLAAGEGQRARELAADLAVPGDGRNAWDKAARAEREALERERQKDPDTMLHGNVESARSSLQDIDRQITVLETEQARRKRELDAGTRPGWIAQMEDLDGRLQRNADAQRQEQEVRPALVAAGLPDHTGALRSELAARRARLEEEDGRARALPAAENEAVNRGAALTARREAFVDAWTRTLGDAPAPGDPTGAAEVLPAQRAEKQRALARMDEPALEAEDARLHQEEATLAAQITGRRHRQQEAGERQLALYAELGAPPGETREALVERFPELAAADERDEAGWRQTLSERGNAIVSNRSRRHENAQSLNILDAHLDLDSEEAAHAQMQKSLAVKRRAGEIVQRTRQSIVSRVMPLTMHNMRQLLPLLTDGRYQDVRWEEASNSLNVYDNRARAFQRKRVFSGGCRDQISLALRLAFALATLPGEHNVRPGWLFLDEPLSSFDRPRTQALVDLLTRGLIRKQFAQIFLVSHSESFDPGRFDYRLRMDGGQVIESTLPLTAPV